MKRSLILLISLVAFIPFVMAQDAKVVERSAKSTPKWLYDQPDNFLVVDVQAPNLSEAKDKAVEEIATRIIMSVAANVVHNSTSGSNVETVDGKVSETETFAFDTKIASARIPFIKGISLTEAKDSYWEKCREKKTNRIFYRYAVLYPLPKAELEKMRNEFEAVDSEKSNKLKALKAGLGSVRSSAQIENAVSDLSELMEYFFDDVRRKEAEGLRTNYKQLYKGLTIKTSQPEKGKFIVTLLLNGKPFEVTGVPVLKANCATRLEAQPLPDGTGYEVTYDDIDCLPEEDNWIEINLRMRDARLKQKIYL